MNVAGVTGDVHERDESATDGRVGLAGRDQHRQHERRAPLTGQQRAHLQQQMGACHLRHFMIYKFMLLRYSTASMAMVKCTYVRV